MSVIFGYFCWFWVLCVFWVFWVFWGLFSGGDAALLVGY